jgi:DNA-directed RNA polymerase subunit beta'
MQKDTLLDHQTAQFDAVRLSLASPEHILEWSHGEVTKPETINYRTQKPEKDGLFCEKIFGPTKDWECYCGKYKRLRYKDVVCDKCGVRVTRSIVRRERMGHISLAVPATHIWFLRGTPSSIGLALNMSIRDLERVVYFASYIVTEVDADKKAELLEAIDAQFELEKVKTLKEYEAKAGEEDSDVKAVAEAQGVAVAQLESDAATKKADIEALNVHSLLSEGKCRDLEYAYPGLFKAAIGAEAIRDLLVNIDLDKMVADLGEEAAAAQGQKRKKILKRLKMLEGMKSAGIRPDWMVMTELPVIPPDLRPMVQLAGGRFAASDLNDLYRRVINRNNRLKRLINLGAPEVICRNEKRMLQEAVDALFDNNARRERAVSSVGSRRKLKSISDMLKGKQGRFRQNLLGKRVDYSGRSVIVAGPELKLYQCGLPKMMALELFKPFIIGRLIELELAHNVKSASRMIERGRNEVWDALEEIIADKYVLLNRAPTLHRLGIQAFQPKLIEGKAIQLHPLVCTAFNADFDGDQMAVHVPLSNAAQREARELMLATKNLLKPADGAVVVNPSQDIVLGCYYMTHIMGDQDVKPAKYFVDVNEAIYNYENGTIKLQTKIAVRINGEMVETNIGRILFNEILPEGFEFNNETMTKKKLQQLIAKVFAQHGSEATAEMVDKMKDLGFKHATRSGLSVGLDDFVIPAKKGEMIAEGEARAIAVSKQYEQGFVTDEERYERTVAIWKQVNEQIISALDADLKGKTTSTNIFVDSGARGDLSQVNQIAGMLGLVADPAGRTIELPIKSNYKEGFSVLEYFNSTHGARKGLTDTALKTAESGYLTRRLVDVAQDVIVTQEDCGDTEGTVISRAESESIGESYAYRLSGRVAAKAIKIDGKTLVKAGALISPEAADAIVASDVETVYIRTALACKTLWGICRNCYGTDLARGRMIELGEPVGVIAAQSIGEPGTQLTMKTFHKGGVAGEDITTGLPRIEEIFEARNPKGPAILAEMDGVVSVTAATGKHIVKIRPSNHKVTEYELGERKATIKSGTKVAVGDVMATDEKGKHALKAKAEGTIEVKKDKILLTHATGGEREYTVPHYQALHVQDGDTVVKGQRLTEGSVNLQDMMNLQDEGAVQQYVISEVQSIYASQGQPISDKHIEIIVRQMLSRVMIEEPGDTLFVTGDIVSRMAVVEENAKLVTEGKQAATYEQLLLGVTKISTSSDSFLSAASFQDTTRVLIAAAIRGKLDHLRGLKENVIIGRLIPVGTGFGDRVKDFLSEDDPKPVLEPVVLGESIEDAAEAVEELTNADQSA